MIFVSGTRIRLGLSQFTLVVLLLPFTCNAVGNRDALQQQSSRCGLHATIVRQVEREGFHRDLGSLVELVAQNPLEWQNCTIALQETIPSGLYVNQDQLMDLERQGTLTACPETFVDVEAAQWQSESFGVLVYSSLETAHNLLYAHIRMPIHLRYHAPTDNGGYAGVYIPPPKLLIRCSNEITCGNKENYFTGSCDGCTGSHCSWLQIPFGTNTPKEGLRVMVPVGNKSLLPIVNAFTFLVTGGGCLYILSILVSTWK
ncbi:hypothetical protein FOCC_FOCC016188 [Frankliniella occidentalis]|uniref:Phosphatidylinositol-glycan biosynthesis class X protein n=1 Tax=Frankliniella occidentalis TaxID=133901 RepID=A0A6J1S362_FRAOC|nr:uncharacterized protein LOC113203236 [Frankliniella occidentalis]KAE8738335.1 hypothetical protein FOCC_FOCC016188 [Frankliniella occidentalis]